MIPANAMPSNVSRGAARWLSLVLVVAAMLVAGCGKQGESAARGEPDAKESRATPVIVADVDLLPEVTRVEAIGTSRAIRSVTLHPVSSGEVTAVGFTPGEAVAQGDVLLRLDRREQALAVELAHVRLADARRALDRFRGMQESGAVTRADLDEATSALESARIELRRAQVALDDRTVEAPFAGHVGISEIDPGDRIDRDTPITTLDDRSALLVRFDVPEVLIDRLRIGDPISVAAWAGRQATINGTVVDIGSRIDPTMRTFVARARVANDDDRLRPGMSFRVSIVLQGSTYPVVPEIAVQWDGDGAYVWTVAGGRAQRVGVEIVQRRAGRVLVDAPLEAGDRVVVEGVQRMRDGLAVSFLDDDVGDPVGTSRDDGVKAVR